MSTCASLIAVMLFGILVAVLIDPGLGLVIMFMTTIASVYYLTWYWAGPTQRRATLGAYTTRFPSWGRVFSLLRRR